MILHRAIDEGSSICWLAMDACWMGGYPIAACALAVPTTVLHVLSVPKSWTDSTRVTAYIGTLGWLSMNESWMMDEEFDIGWARIAKYCCLAVALAATIVSIATRKGSFQWFRTSGPRPLTTRDHSCS